MASNSRGDSASGPETLGAEGLGATMAQGTFVLGLGLFAGMGVNVFGGLWLAVQLGPEAWGLYLIAASVVTVAQVLFEKGAIAYIIQKPYPLTRGELGTAASIQTGLGLIAAASGWMLLRPLAVSYLHQGQLDELLACASLAALAYSLRALPISQLERRLSYGRVALIELADPLLFFTCAFLFLQLGQGITSLSLAILARAFGSLLLALQWAGFPKVAWEAQAARDLLRFGLPILGLNTSLLLNGLADPVVLALFAGPSAIAWNQVATTVLNLPGALTSLLARVSFSGLSRVQQDRVRLNRYGNETLGILALLVVPLTVALAGLAPLWVQLLGPAWQPIVLSLLIAAIPFAAGHILMTLFAPLNATGSARSVLILNTIFGVVYTGASLVLVPTYGYLAPAFAALASCPFLLVLPRLYARTIGPMALGQLLLILATGTLFLAALWLAGFARQWGLLIGLSLVGGLIWAYGILVLIRKNPGAVRWLFGRMRPCWPN